MTEIIQASGSFFFCNPCQEVSVFTQPIDNSSRQAFCLNNESIIGKHSSVEQ